MYRTQLGPILQADGGSQGVVPGVPLGGAASLGGALLPDGAVRPAGDVGNVGAESACVIRG